jgi:NAD(P)-dependent dehydrogenase (short-subunit alcohol dehydrogenase family)
VSGLRLDGAGVVVTGAASGIGLGLAARFAAQGARVVVADLDRERLREAAPAGSTAVVADVGTREGVQDLVGRSLEVLGEVDLFCANAGVPTPGGVEPPGLADDAAWQRTWDVNLMSHVWTAQQLVPRWVERGGGRLLVTASAAGLLTMLGSAPYSVTKHAAVAFAEWLRATYAHRGVVVQALCPQGVRTPLLEGSGPLGQALLAATAVEVEDVVRTVLEALQDDRFLVLPHPEVAGYVRHRAQDPDGWLAGMNRLQRRVEAPGAPPPA